MGGQDLATPPVEIELDRVRELRIRWADGEQSVCSLVRLRRACPCAECQQMWAEEQENPLRVMRPPGEQLNMVTAEKVELVGRYAVQITWMDGHSGGIYDYALLRSLGGELAKGG